MKVLQRASASRYGLATVYLLAAALLAAAPLFTSDFRLNLLAKFLAFAIAAVGLDLLWGYTGILSLGHGVFFGLGGYAMAMHLKLQASGGKLPDFMEWSGLSKLPWFWTLFQSFGMSVMLGIAIPSLVALFLGYFTFRNRIRGVYFTILTQALVVISVTLITGQQAFTGGTNGITGYGELFGYSLAAPEMKIALYYVTAAVLVLVFLLSRFLVKSRFGKVLRAVRDGENRVRFLGYNPAKFQMAVFVLSAAFSGIAGMLFVLHVGIISPSMMGIVPSIEMVLWVAIGGRGTLIGAALGAVLMNGAKSAFSETYPEIWLFFMGALFIVTTVFLPCGIVGLVADGWHRLRLLRRRRKGVPEHERSRYSAV
ncbi:urea transport system permease protein [Paenibacillaceae bacterium GAS479]|nr:urea transport system permease protein [Paenibacillaceae bacterium GAS479]